MSADIKSLGSFVWSIAELLRGDLKQSEYGKVILPFVVLRRLTDEMLNLLAFKLQKGEEGSASLFAGETSELQPITEFGANPYSEEEERSLSEIIGSFNERHGTQFFREDFLRFERVTCEIMDEDMTEMVKNNPADAVYNAFSQAFFQGMVKMFQQDNEMRNQSRCKGVCSGAIWRKQPF